MSQIGSNPAERCKWFRRAWRWTVLHQCIGKGVVLFAPLLWAQTAHAHGIAGNRSFDGTMTFDDPSVADEAILPYGPILNIRPKAATLLRTASTELSRGC